MSLSPEFWDDVALIEGHVSRASAPQHSLSSTKVTATVKAGDIDGERLCAFASRGNLVEIDVRSGDDYSIRFQADATSKFTAQDQHGYLGAVAVDQAAAEAAVEAGRFLDLAAVISDSSISLALTLRAPAGGTPFVWSAEALFNMVGSWVGLAQLLAKNSELLVLQAGPAIVTTETLAIYGPHASPGSVPPVSTWSRDSWHLAPPHHYLPTSSADMGEIVSALHKLAAGVAWLRISNRPIVSTPGADLGIVGVSFGVDRSDYLMINWSNLPDGAAEASRLAELWRWLDQDDQTGRMEAARQAAVASVHSAADLRDAATPVLRQARFLHDLSRKQAVAAIVEARKATWSSCQTAAHTAGAEARASARSTADRTVAAVIAALAVVITYQTAVLSRPVSYLVLAAVLVGIVAAFLHAYAFEFPATEAALDASLEELSTTHRDILLSDDVREIVTGPVVQDTRATLRNARIAAAIALGVGTLAVVIGAFVVSTIEPNQVADTREPTTTSTPGAAVTVSSVPTTTAAARPPSTMTAPGPASTTSTAPQPTNPRATNTP